MAPCIFSVVLDDDLRDLDADSLFKVSRNRKCSMDNWSYTDLALLIW